MATHSSILAWKISWTEEPGGYHPRGSQSLTQLSTGTHTCTRAHSVMSDFATVWTVAYQAPLSMGFSRQEYWSGLSLPSPGDLPDPGIEPTSVTYPALAGRFFITSAAWKMPRHHTQTRKHPEA